MKAEVVLHLEGTKLGEGPIWNHQKNVLHWVDILNGLLHTYNPATNTNDSIQFDQMVGAAIPCENSDDFLLAMQYGFAFFNSKTNEIKPITNPEQNKPLNRFNDGKCDPVGRLWTGTMAIDPSVEKATGALYRLDTNLALTKQLSDIFISNGLGWTNAGDKLFYIDTLQFKIMSFDYDISTGNISNQQDFLTFDKELADGLCIDENDNIWVAFYLGGKVVCFDSKTGKILEKIEVPALCTTSCCFGGENLDTLYITSAAKEGDALGGGLFQAKPGVKGMKSVFFKRK